MDGKIKLNHKTPIKIMLCYRQYGQKGIYVMKEFNVCFQMSKMILFKVSYYTLGDNQNPYFTTSAYEFVRNKRDFARVGQCQEDLLKGFRTAYNFYKKWDVFHLKQLTQEQYSEMRNDLCVLEQKYNNLLSEMEDGVQLKPDYFSFYQLVEFSKQTPKK